MNTQFTPSPWTRTAGERFKHDQSAGIRAASAAIAKAKGES